MARVRTRVKLSHKLFEQVVQSPAVRAAIARQAREIAAAASGIARSEDADTEISVEAGTRPRGRTYARVVSSNDDQSEWGDRLTARRRILGRAAGLRSR